MDDAIMTNGGNGGGGGEIFRFLMTIGPEPEGWGVRGN